MNALKFESVTLAGSERPRLANVDFELARGECAFLLGPNGAGKSSILRLALGLEKPDQGHVWLGGQRVDELTAKGRAAQVAWLPQQLSFEQALTARDVVAAARYRFGESSTRSHARAQAWLAEVQAAALADRRVTKLSGGELQRVKLAALLAQETPLLLLDEPANHLDPAYQLEVYRLLGAQWLRGLGILCVTHDINLLSLLPSPERIRLFGVQKGELCFVTSYADPALCQKLAELYGIEFEQIERVPSSEGSSVPRRWFLPRAERAAEGSKLP
jgi:iron complex transport system ATP-binding protein